MRSVAAILDGTPDAARDMLETLDELSARQKPKQAIVIGRNEEIKIDVLLHRAVMGAAVRPDSPVAAPKSSGIHAFVVREPEIAVSRDARLPW